jgi:hypothetical protein
VHYRHACRRRHHSLMPNLTDRTREGEGLVCPDPGTQAAAAAPAVMDFWPSTDAGLDDDFMAIRD